MSSRREPAWLPFVVLAALWLGLWRMLSVHWSANPQYSFGWLVPLLQIYLTHRRWSTRPAAEAPPAWARLLALLAAFALLPTWIIAQPNPDWPLVTWLFSGEVVALTLATLALLGGRAWLRYFAFPVALILTAVPWPSALENPIVQGLMQQVAAVTVELLNFFGTPALQHGNLIEIGAGLLGVDEACSGVRSLQATLMATLFLGEFYRFRWSIRLLLVIAGFIVAFVTNVGRTLWLSGAAARGGMEAVNRWHDPAGFTILTICLFVVWLLALWILRHQREEVSATAAMSSPHPWPRFFGGALGLWLLASFALTELWYGPSDAPVKAAWTVTIPPGAQPQPIDIRTAAMLRYDRGFSATWQEANGTHWTLFFLEWEPGPSRSRILARMHRPDVCLPALGLQQVDEPRMISVQAAGHTLPFQAWRFRESVGRDAFVYYCPWENRPAKSAATVEFTDSSRAATLRQVWRRERHLGQQVLELVVFGYTRAEDADAAFRQQVERLVQSSVPK